MPITLTPFPSVPESRSALTSAGIRQYVTSPAWANFQNIETLLESIETVVNALPGTTRSATMPTSAALSALWVDSSSNDQPKLCILAYTVGNGTSANWISLRDATATAISTTIANSQSPSSTQRTLLKNDITSYAADLSLSTDERTILTALQSEMTTRYSEIVAAAANFALTGNAAYTTYTAAYTAWQTLGPLPANPIPGNFATIWNALIDAEATILALIRTTANTLISTLNGNLTSIQNTVDDMASDNEITALEKIALKTEYDRIVAEKTALTSLATTLAHTGATQYTTYVAAYDALVTLVTVTHVVFGANIGVTTTLTDGEVTTWNTTWQAYYASARAFDSYVDTQFKTNLDTFSSTLSTYGTTISNISSNSIVSGGTEKLTLQREWQAVYTAKAGLEAKAAVYGVGITGNSLDAAYTALNTYLNTTLGVFGDMDSNTTGVNSATLNNLFNNFRTEYNSLDNFIQRAVNSTLTSLSAGIASFSNDNVITISERNIVKMMWEDIQNKHASVISQAATYSVSTTTLVNNYSALSTYLTTTLDLFNATADVTIVRSTFDTFFNNWSSQYKVVSDAVETARKGALDAATNSISALTADGTVNGGSEKRLLKNIWDDIVSKNVVLSGFATTFSVSIPANYTNAYNALDTYLNSTLGIFTSMTADTNVDRGQMEALFNAYRTQYDLLSALVATAQSTAITTAVPTGYANFTALIDSMVDDNIIAAGAEKVWFNAIWADITATHATFIATATNSGVGTTGLTNAYNALNTYLNTTLSNFTIINVNTNANHQIVLGLFRDYETQKAILNQDIIAAALVAVRDSSAAIADMNNDGVISAVEKATIFRTWTRYGIEQTNAVTQANALSIVTERNAMTTAYNTLSVFLGSGDVNLFANMNTNTTLTNTQNNAWDTNWFTYETAYMALMTAIQSAQISNNISTSNNAIYKDGSTTITNDIPFSNYNVTGLGDGLVSAISTEAVNGKQLYTEQQARISGDAAATSSANGYADGLIATEVTNRNNAIGDHRADNNYAAAGADLHGLGSGDGDIVGTAKMQTLTAKSISGEQINSGAIAKAQLQSVISDAVYGVDWDDVTDVAPSKNAVYDKVNAMVSDTAYAATWSTVTDVAPSKKAVYDKIEALNTLITAAGNDFLCYAENSTSQTTQAIVGTGIDTSSPSYSSSSFHLRMIMAWNHFADIEVTLKKRSGGNIIAIMRTQRPYDADIPGTVNGVGYYAISTNFADSNQLIPLASSDGTTQDFVRLERDDVSNELCFKFITDAGRESRSLTVLEGQLSYTGTVISPGQGTKL